MPPKRNYKEKSVYLPSSHLGAWEPGSHSGLSGPWTATADTVKSPFEAAATLVMRRARPAKKEGLADPALLTTLLHVPQFAIQHVRITASLQSTSAHIITRLPMHIREGMGRALGTAPQLDPRFTNAVLTLRIPGLSSFKSNNRN